METFSGESVQLVKLRNPLGPGGEYVGGWGGGGLEWDEVPLVERDRLAIRNMAEGEFWFVSMYHAHALRCVDCVLFKIQLFHLTRIVHIKGFPTRISSRRSRTWKLYTLMRKRRETSLPCKTSARGTWSSIKEAGEGESPPEVVAITKVTNFLVHCVQIKKLSRVITFQKRFI